VHDVKCFSVRKPFCDFELREDGSRAVSARFVGWRFVWLMSRSHIGVP
jgi:hypothetical protein